MMTSLPLLSGFYVRDKRIEKMTLSDSDVIALIINPMNFMLYVSLKGKLHLFAHDSH